MTQVKASEALARQGRIPEGRARLDEWRPRLDDAVTGRLETLLAEQEGGNPRALRLARFEATDAEPDLLALIGALSEACDDRLADYSAWDIDLRLNTNAARLDCRSSELFLQDGTRIAYNQTSGKTRIFGSTI